MTRSIVTGGAGFIGSHVVDALVARGDEVHVVDDLSSGRREQVNAGATFHELDIRDAVALLALREQLGPIDTWYHLAAQADVRVSVANPILDATVNVIGTLAVLDVARVDGAPVVFTSTGGAIYGECVEPASEQVPAQPTSPYGAHKLAAECCIAQDARLHGARHAVLRLANVYGPRQDPHGEAGVVAIFAGRIHGGQAATIFGTGNQTRDYVFVADVAEAVLAAADSASDGRDSSLREQGDVPVYNIGTSIETSVLELWTAMVAAAGTDPGSALAPARLGELDRSALEPARARNVLGVALDTSIDVGLVQTLEAMAPTA